MGRAEVVEVVEILDTYCAPLIREASAIWAAAGRFLHREPELGAGPRPLQSQECRRWCSRRSSSIALDPLRGRRTTCRGRPTPTAARRSPSSPAGPATSRGRKPNPATATNAGYLAPHPRGRAPVGARARHGHLLLHRRLPLVHPRADPAPALLVLPAVPALRARARRGHGRAGRDRRRPGAAQAVRRGAPRRACGRTTSCWRAWSERFADVAERRPCAASRPGRRPGRCCPTPPRPGSWSPATTGPGGTSSPCGPASTPTWRSASWPWRACAQLQRVAPNVFADFMITALADGTEVAASPYAVQS